MAFHVTITTIQRLAHLKRGPCHSLSLVRHHGSVLQIHPGRCKGSGAPFTPTGLLPPLCPLISILVFPRGDLLSPSVPYRTLNGVPPDISKVPGCAEW